MKEKIFDLLLKRFRLPADRFGDLPSARELFHIVRSLRPKEQIAFGLLALVFLTTAIVILVRVNNAFLVEIPISGGTYVEGVVGTPRFINPILAVSDSDKDLSALIYSGLLRPEDNGLFIPDLAEHYEVSADGLRYTFVLRKNLLWQDGVPITSEDVEFTVNLARDEQIKSPRRANWEGVRVERPDEQTVVFVLTKPYAPFLENATMGILPKHLWKNLNPEEVGLNKYNTEAIGSGPYKITRINKDKSGIPQSYELGAFGDFALGKPYISKIIFRFFDDEEGRMAAFKNGQIDAVAAVAPEKVKGVLRKDTEIKTAVLPRVFGVFFNQNQAEIFANIEVRQALAAAVDREALIKEILFGYGKSTQGPLPSSSFGFTSETIKDKSDSGRTEEAISILESHGWKKNDAGLWEKKLSKKKTLSLSFTITTSNSGELKRVAELLKETWSKLSIPVKLDVYEIGDLNQNVIRPRKYDALLFGLVLGRLPDPFAFWHSSGRLDPGLNIALYTKTTVDKMLESAREAKTRKDYLDNLAQFQKAIDDDTPAVFLYSPELIFLVNDKIKNVDISDASTAGERFLNIYRWYIYTDRVWRIFAPSKD